MKYPRFFVVLALLLVGSQQVWAQSPKPVVRYYGIYLKEAKIGHMFTQRESGATFEGKPAVKTLVRSVMSINMMGAGSQITAVATIFANPKTGLPYLQDTRQEASGRVTQIRARYTERSVQFDADMMGTKKSGTLMLGPGERFLDEPSSGANIKPQAGLRLKGKSFQPDTLSLTDMEVTFGEKEPVLVNGQTIAAFKVATKGTIPTTSWVDETGELLRASMVLGIELRLESKEQALAPAGKTPELTSLVGTKPTGESLTEARRSRTATYEIGGITRPFPAADSVQRWELLPDAPATEKNEKTIRLTITSGPLPTVPTAPLFARASDAPERLRRFLKSSEYVHSDDPELRALARRTIGSETDAAKAAAALAAFVHDRIKPDPSIAAVRTARDIHSDPRGVCRDYTTYFTTLARAIGLPTKQCVGMAYANGLFLYHAWPEVWIGTDENGDDLWVALEPTWGAPFADATHIKLVEGEITDIAAIAADMGRYTVKVLSLR